VTPTEHGIRSPLRLRFRPEARRFRLVGARRPSPPGGHVHAQRDPTPLCGGFPVPLYEGVQARLSRTSPEPPPRRGRLKSHRPELRGRTGSVPQRARPRSRRRSGWGQGAKQNSHFSGAAPGLALECRRRTGSEFRGLHSDGPGHFSASWEVGPRHGFESPTGLRMSDRVGGLLRRAA